MSDLNKHSAPAHYATASIETDCFCTDCGWPVIFACCNGPFREFKDAAEWDWWMYCANHEGEGKFQDQLAWVEYVARSKRPVQPSTEGFSTVTLKIEPGIYIREVPPRHEVIAVSSASDAEGALSSGVSCVLCVSDKKFRFVVSCASAREFYSVFTSAARFPPTPIDMNSVAYDMADALHLIGKGNVSVPAISGDRFALCSTLRQVLELLSTTDPR